MKLVLPIAILTASMAASAANTPAPTISAPASATFTRGVPIAPIVPALSSDVTSVSISPDITARLGLAFNARNGTISGTPDCSASATYTLTALNAAGKKATAAIAIKINEPPPAISLNPASYGFLVGASIADIKPVLGASVTSVSISPDITNTGLKFDAGSGKISGKPATAQALTTYTLTAKNQTGQTATASFQLTLRAVAPPVAPPPSRGPGCEYTLSIADFQSTSANVPQQRVFAGSTEVFAGADGYYHVPLTDAAGKVIVDSDPLESAPVGSWAVQRARASFVAGNRGHQDDGGLSGYVAYVTAATLNCNIVSVTNDGFEKEGNGTYLLGDAGDDQYTVSGNAIYASSTTTTAADLYRVKFQAAPVCSAPQLTVAATGSNGHGVPAQQLNSGLLPVSLIANVAALAASSGCTLPVSNISVAWSVVAAPAGSRALVTPSANASPAGSAASFEPDLAGNYELRATATASDGAQQLQATASVDITAYAPPAPPTALAATAGNAQVVLDWTQSTATELDHDELQGFVCAAGIPGCVPAGAGIDIDLNNVTYTDNSVVNGSSYGYQLRAIDVFGQAGPWTAVAIATPEAPPQIAYGSSLVSCTLGAICAIAAPGNSGGPASQWSAAGLPAGLSMDPSSGNISGIPNTLSGSSPAAASVRAANAGGSASASLSINIVDIPPAISYSGALHCIAGSYCSLGSPSSTGGAVLSYSAPGLPAGLSIDNTGAISGTPASAAPAANDSVTATNSGGSITVSVNIAIASPGCSAPGSCAASGAACTEGIPGASACAAPPGLAGAWSGEGNGNDGAGNANGTLVGAMQFAPGVVDQAFLFDGATSYVQIPDAAEVDPTQGLTLDAWILPASLPPAGVSVRGESTPWWDLISKDNPASGPYLMRLHQDGSLSMYVWTSAGFLGATTPPCAVSAGSWQHVAGTYDGASGNVCIYVDGNATCTSNPPGTLSTNGNPLKIGVDYYNSRYFQGEMDQVELYGRALSAAEVDSIHSAGSAGRCQQSNTVTLDPASAAAVASIGDLGLSSGGVPIDGTRTLFFGANSPYIYDGSNNSFAALSNPRWGANGGAPQNYANDYLRTGNIFFYTEVDYTLGEELFKFDADQPISPAADEQSALCVYGNANPCSFGGLSGLFLNAARISGTRFVALADWTQTSVDAVSVFVYDFSKPTLLTPDVLNPTGYVIHSGSGADMLNYAPASPPIFQPCSSGGNPCYVKLPTGTEYDDDYYTGFLLNGDDLYVETLPCDGPVEIIYGLGGSNQLSGCSSWSFAADDITHVDLATGTSNKAGSILHYSVFNQIDGQYLAESTDDATSTAISLSPFAIGANEVFLPGTAVDYAPLSNSWLYNTRGYAGELAFGDSSYFVNGGNWQSVNLVRRTGGSSTLIPFNSLTGDSWVADMRPAGDKLLLLSELEGYDDVNNIRTDIGAAGSLWLYDPSRAELSGAMGTSPICGAVNANPCLLGFPDGDLLEADSRGVIVNADGSLIVAGKKGAYSCSGNYCSLGGGRRGPLQDVFAFDATGAFTKSYGLSNPSPATFNQGICLVYFEMDGAPQFTDAFTADGYYPPAHSQGDCESETVQYYWGGDPKADGYDWAASFVPSLPINIQFSADYAAPSANGGLNVLSSESRAQPAAESWTFTIDRGDGPVAVTAQLENIYLPEPFVILQVAR